MEKMKKKVRFKIQQIFQKYQLAQELCKKINQKHI